MDKAIKIEGLTEYQVKLANILWQCENNVQVAAVIALFGKEAKLVRELMVAAALDTLDETDVAEKVLAQFRL